MGNAKGTLGPPMVVLPYKRIPLIIAKSMPDSWGIGRSDSGWMTGELFFEYIANIFYPWLVKEQIEFPIVLFVDGHTSHMTLALSEFCNSKKIILISLLPNATSILQPMDVAYFHPLKQAWRNAVKNWRMEHNGARIRREDFGPLLSSILGNVRFEENLRNGFKACGLYPLDANAINFGKLISNEFKPLIESNNSNSQQSNILNNLKDHLEHLESYLGDLKLNLFEMALLSNSWTGTKEDTCLFEYWRNLKNKIAAINNSERKLDCDEEPSYLNIAETLDNNLLGLDSMDVDLDVILGENSALTLNVEFDGSVTVENEHQTPKKLDTRINNDLPTPFKQNLIWPTPKLETISCKREKLPAVVSSQQWILYSKNKMDKKEKENNEKEERKRQRQEKIEKKRNYCSDSGKREKKETVTSASTTYGDLELEVQQYVIVKYEGELFPGIIQNVKKDEYFVRVMCMSGNHWNGPRKMMNVGTARWILSKKLRSQC